MPLKNETIIQLKKSELHTQCEICCPSVNMTFDSFLFENCAYRYTNCIQTFFFNFILRSLYPGLEHRFILESIKPSVMDSLKKAAKCRGNVTYFFNKCIYNQLYSSSDQQRV